MQIAAQAITGSHRFTRNHLFPVNNGFGIAAQIEVYVTTLHALDDAGDQLTDTVLVGFHHLRTLCFADLLYNDLLGGLCTDAPEFNRIHGLLNELPQLDIRICLACFFKQDLPRGKTVPPLFFVVILIRLRGFLNHFPATEGIVLAGLAVNRYPDLDILFVTFFRCRRQRRFDRVEYHFLADTLFIGYSVYHQQHIFTHYAPSVRCEL